MSLWGILYLLFIYFRCWLHHFHLLTLHSIDTYYTPHHHHYSFTSFTHHRYHLSSFMTPFPPSLLHHHYSLPSSSCSPPFPPSWSPLGPQAPTTPNASNPPKETSSSQSVPVPAPSGWQNNGATAPPQQGTANYSSTFLMPSSFTL